MDEQDSHQYNKLSVAQWSSIIIVVVTVFIFWVEEKSGDIENTSYLFWTDVFVYFIDVLIGFGILYYFRRYQVK